MFSFFYGLPHRSALPILLRRFSLEPLQGGQNARPEAPRLFDKDGDRLFQDPDEPKEITLRFSVVTEYRDPNFENRYPAALTVATDPVTISARFGDTVRIVVRGGREEGYRAELSD